jgi:competence protein ComEC
LVGRRPDLVTLTVLAAALQLMVRPEDYWTVSFRLSFVAALALALVLRGVESDSLMGWIRYAIVGTVAAQIATTPILLAYFGRVSLYALPTNLLIAPVVNIAFPLALLASLLGIFAEPLGVAFGTIAAPFSALITAIVEWMAGLPGAGVSGGKPNWFEIAVISLFCGGLVAGLSADGRRTVRSGWQWLRSEPRSAMAIGSISGLGCLIGLAVGAIR